MAKAKVLRTDYKEAADDKLDRKATAVEEGMTAHAIQFPAPPVNPIAMAALILTYGIKFSAYKRGGLDQKPAFVAAKTALLQALDSNADYVDEIADGNEELIVNAGFVPTKTSGTPKPAPSKPEGVKAKRGQAVGEILVECKPQKGVVYYGLIVSVGTPLSDFNFTNGQMYFGPSTVIRTVDVNKARKKRAQELEAGTTYYFYMFCGNSNGVSALSDAVVMMAA